MRTTSLISLSLILASLEVGVISQRDQSCRTPDNRNGQCIPLRDCSSLYTMMLRVIQFANSLHKEVIDRHLSHSQCGVEDEEEPFHPLVCCPVPRDPPDVSNHANIHRINHKKCGRSGSDRVVNGQSVGLLQYRWMVLLAYGKDGGKFRFRCGGSLINERYVLTAAHCLTDDKNLLFVRVGEYNTSTSLDCETNEDEEDNSQLCLEEHLDIGVEQRIRHPNFISTSKGSDVGVIRLNQDVSLYGISTSTICLPVVQNQMNFSGRDLIVTGWGNTETGQASKVLAKAELPVVRNDDCHAIYRALYNYVIDETMICAGDHRDSCKGDSGGPLQIKLGAQLYQFGIVSYGPSECGKKGVPGVYTKVSYYMDWILDQMV